MKRPTLPLLLALSACSGQDAVAQIKTTEINGIGHIGPREASTL